MNDNEAEVDLAVSASILLSNNVADENETPETTSDDVKLNQVQEEQTNEVVSSSRQSNVEVVEGDATDNEPTTTTIIIAGEDNPIDDATVTVVSVADREAEDQGEIIAAETVDDHHLEEIKSDDTKENKDIIDNPNSDSLTKNEDTTDAKEGISDRNSAIVSRDHISPAPNLTPNVTVVDSSTTTTQTEESPKKENGSPTNISEGGGNGRDDKSTSGNAVDSTDSGRPLSSSQGKTINVNFKTDSGDKTLSVKIVDATYKKPFLGGFKHKHTGQEFLNASSQTYPKKTLPKNVEVFNRDTQTVQMKSQIQQTSNNTSTQMTKPGCYVSDLGDVIRIPGKYVSAAEKEKIKLEKIIIIQSYWRRWLASQYVKKLKMDRDLRIEWELKESKRIAAERVERLRQEFERRMKPKTKADFDLLYAALERWRQEEIDRINNSHSGPERKAALIALLEQEAYLIQSIERHRLIADESNYSDNVVNFLDKAAQPKFWRAYDGRKTEMNTNYSLRAQELRDLYNSLQMKYLNQDERLDVLLTLKHTVKEHDCKLTQDLIELIDREADLLTRNVKSSNLEGLRQRISTLFLQYCKTPSFNPDVARLLKVPTDTSTLRKDVYFCPSCNSYLPSTEFPLASNSRIVGRCKKCSKLDNNARLRHDFTKIRSILQHLRRSEEDLNDGSKIAFIIQDADLRYLIEKIWNSQSALSGVEDLYDLVFVRWNKYEHWSPWNCLLLTKEEASAHMKLEGVAEAYGRIFVGKVHHRHVVAKQYFSKLTKIANNMTKTTIPNSKINTSNKIEAAVM